jgi:hypothetical protein
MYPVMAKVKERNWLLLITGLLVLASAVFLLTTKREEIGLGICRYNGVEYLEGELVSSYEGGSDCYCSWTGEIVCQEDEVGMSYDGFVNQGLSFSYSFKNFLDKPVVDLAKVVVADINYRGNSLQIVLEKEALCGELSEAPVQTAMYKFQEDGLVLTTITNRDESIYTRVCLIGNTFEIEDVDLSEKSEYYLYYQNDKGQIFDLEACFTNNRLYAKGDVFKNSQEGLLCTCNGPDIECEEL